MPTFRLDEAAPALSFALTVTGSPRHSSLAGDNTRKLLSREMGAHMRAIDLQSWRDGHGVIAPDAAAAHVELLEDEPSDEERLFEDKKPVGCCIFFVHAARI